MTRLLLLIEMISFGCLVLWMAHSMWLSARGDKRFGDPVRLVLGCFSALLVYRDWRIMYADDSDQAKILMCVFGLLLCAFSALAAKAYGRGAPLN